MNQSLTSGFLGEFLGTAMFIFCGAGSVAAAQVAGADLGLWEISIIWGLAVSIAVYTTAGLSGAHFNPVVTISMWLFAGFEGRKVLPYIIFQFLGAFFAAFLVYLIYKDLISASETAHHIIRGESVGYASIFSTYANEKIGLGTAFLVEAIIVCLLLIVIFALGDENNGEPRKALIPFLLGLFIAIVGGATGPLTGFAMNPARDFAPKVFAYFAGWGEIAFTGGREIPYFLIPIFAPLIGGLIGAFIYKKILTPHLIKQGASND